MNSWETLYSFSYPHISYAKKIEEEFLKKEKNDSTRNEIKLKIKKANYKTPDFNRTNQYFEKVNVFLAETDNYYYKLPNVIPGKSGSPKITSNYYLYGVESLYIEQFDDTHRDCMLRKEILSSFIQIIRGSE